MGAVVIFCTIPNKDEAKKISKALLNENLAACCSIVDKISSLFLTSIYKTIPFLYGRNAVRISFRNKVCS